MLLDQLYRLATDGGAGGDDDYAFRARNLGVVAQEYAGLSVPKDDPYRVRYGEIIGVPFADVDPGFLDYAILDAVATWRAYVRLRELCQKHQWLHSPARGEQRYEMYPRAWQRFGVLTEAVQVKAAVVLASAYRLGIAVDPGKAELAEARLRVRIEEAVRWIKENYPQLFRYYKVKARAGDFMVNAHTGVPKFQQKEMRAVLGALAAERGLTPPRTGKTKEVSASLDVWRNLLPDHRLVQTWVAMMDAGKLLSFVLQVKGRRTLHPSYKTLVRTGRTSAFKGELSLGLNIQQMPREGWFRELFVPRPGYKLVSVDYSFIELRTLASVCYGRFGRSVLGDVIKGGTDPHAYTAALLLGSPVAGFVALKASDPATYKHHRQAAKAVNFGVPGGLGAEKLAAYAKASYGVAMTREQAARFKQRLITEVYPELSLYLADRSSVDLAENLGVAEANVRYSFDLRPGQEGLTMGAVRKVAAGKAVKADGTPYNAAYTANVWRTLEKLYAGTDERVREALARREGGSWLEGRLFSRTVPTLTGRLRAGVSYTEARNTPFQGLAADGAKLALWELHKAGYLVVAFVHDEILLEVPADRAEDEARKASAIMDRAMEQVLFPGVPSACEYAVGDYWVKP
jgi:hypothetical protein